MFLNNIPASPGEVLISRRPLFRLYPLKEAIILEERAANIRRAEASRSMLDVLDRPIIPPITDRNFTKAARARLIGESVPSGARDTTPGEFKNDVYYFITTEAVAGYDLPLSLVRCTSVNADHTSNVEYQHGT